MPDSISPAARRRRTRRRRLGAFAAGVVVIGAGGGAALAATASNDPELITGTVTTGSVTQTVEASGTVSAPSTTNAAFAASGTVAEVGVAVGDTVTQGEVLATLQTTDLENKVTSAKAEVASAEQRLEDDETGQASSVSSGSAGGSGAQYSSAVTTDSVSEVKFTSVKTAVSAASTPPPAGSSAAGGQSGLQSAQQAVIAAQQQVDKGQLAVDAAQSKLDADVQTNSADRDAQQTECAAAAADCASATATYENFADTLTADSAALKTAVAAQDAALKNLDGAISALDAVVARSSSTSSSSSGGSKSGTTGTTGSTAAGNAGASGSTAASGTRTGNSGTGATGTAGSSSSAPASASQLAADQAAIDSAKAQLRLAKQNLAAATLKSPVSGTVAAVGLTAGGSSSGSITILGKGNQVVSIGVPLSEIDQVKTGQNASIQVDGQSAALHGTVTKIGLVSSTSGSLTTFPVTVTLASGSPVVHDGVGGDVTITTGTASAAVVVPNSAITTVGTHHLVTVVSGGKSQTVAVTLGLIGSDVSQVTAGVKAGAQVQLADPSRALPSSTTPSTNSRFGGAGFTLRGGAGGLGGGR